MGISDSNEVVFASGTTGGGSLFESFSWKNGTKTSIVGLGGANVYTKITKGGVYFASSGYYDGATFVRFPDDLGPGYFQRQVRAFNDNLYGVGSIHFEGSPLAYLYEAGSVRVGVLGGFEARGLDINKDNFALVGDSRGGGSGTLHYGNGTTWTNVSSFFGELAGAFSNGAALNDKGQIAYGRGIYSPNSSGGYDRVVAPLTGSGASFFATDINNHGWMIASPFNTPHHVLSNGVNSWELPEVIENLPAGSSQFRAEQINDNGWIVGTYKIGQDQHAFVLQPVPEPMSLLALGAGVAALMRRRRSS